MRKEEESSIFFFFLIEMNFTLISKTRKFPLELILYAGNLFALTYAPEVFAPFVGYILKIAARTV